MVRIESTLNQWNTHSTNGDSYGTVNSTGGQLDTQWSGYWLKTKVENLVLTIPKLATAGNLPPLPSTVYDPPTAPPIVKASESEIGFQLRLALTAEKSADLTTTLGTRVGAKEGLDVFDTSEPPQLSKTDDDDAEWSDMRMVQSVELKAGSHVTQIPLEIRATRIKLEPIADLSVVSGEAEVKLTWKTSDNAYIEGYTVYRNTEALYQVSKTEASFTDKAVEEEMSYTYQVGVHFQTGVELKNELFTVKVMPLIKETVLLHNYPNPFTKIKKESIQSAHDYWGG